MQLIKDLLARSYQPGKWSIRFILHHLADSETVLYERIRRVLAEPRPVLWVADPDAWAKGLDYAQVPLSLSRTVFESVRNAIIYYAGQHYESHGHLEFVHSVTGVRTLKDELEKVASHNAHHLSQIKAALKGIRLALGAVFVALGAIACGRPDTRGSGSVASGQRLAQRYCQTCHLLPSPGLLDRATWERWVLPRMALRLGLARVGGPADDEPIEGGVGGELIRAAGVFPDTPQISRAEWERLAAYYLHEAPDSLPPAAIPRVTVGMPGFSVRVPDFHINSPMVTLVHVDPPHGRIYVGDATPGRSTLTVLDGRKGSRGGRAVTTFPIPSPVSHLHVSRGGAGDTLGVLLMGKLQPSDAPRGVFALISAWRSGAKPEIAWEVDSLQRPVYASYADLSGDGIEDVVLSEFGNLTGRLTWYERLPGKKNRRHLLASQPGALNTVVRDFDGDGRLDVLALFAQGDEGVLLFHGQPGGEFSGERLLRFPPSYGSTSMELVDVNHDGHPDIVYTNGDAGDYPGRPKPYHGIRIFLNDGRGRFVEQYFFAMPGAFKAIARDFDGDGDVDIAAIAFFTDYASGAPLSFVYLENVGGLRFRAWTFADADRGRWLVMDAGDVDGDGDIDLVLGSFAQLDAQADRRELSARWRQRDAPTILILENTGHNATLRKRGP